MDSTNKNGLMAGFLSILLITMLYVSDPTLLVKGYVWLKQFVFFGAMAYGMSQLRDTSISTSNLSSLKSTADADTSKDFIGLVELLGAGFKIYLIGYLFTFLYIYLLFNFIDPSLVELVKDGTVKIAIETRDPSITEEIFQQKIQQLREQDFSPSITDFLSVMSMVELLIGFVMAFVLALFFQREKPNY